MCSFSYKKLFLSKNSQISYSILEKEYFSLFNEKRFENLIIYSLKIFLKLFSFFSSEIFLNTNLMNK